MRAFFRSFRYAAHGIRVAVREERNLRFHLCIGLYVYLFSAFYDFGRTEYMLLTILVAGVISLELVNSALERSEDDPPPEHYRLAGLTKDMAAGAVLVFSIAAAVCGVILFWDIAAFQRIFRYFTGRPLLLAALLASMALCYCFVFLWNRKQKRK